MRHQTCPFCGGANVVVVSRDSGTRAWAYCRDCAALGPEAKAETREEAERDAWELWDKRATPPAASDLLAATIDGAGADAMIDEFLRAGDGA